MNKISKIILSIVLSVITLACLGWAWFVSGMVAWGGTGESAWQEIGPKYWLLFFVPLALWLVFILLLILYKKR